MPLSSYCHNCHKPNATTAEMGADHCDGCEKIRTDAMTGAKEANPELTQDQLLYVGRTAMLGAAGHARSGSISPRDFHRLDR